jgi:hypothetical protein
MRVLLVSLLLQSLRHGLTYPQQRKRSPSSSSSSSSSRRSHRVKPATRLPTQVQLHSLLQRQLLPLQLPHQPQQ